MTREASIVVPTRGRPHLLRRCLHALIAQDLQPPSFEVIVVDDGDGDESRQTVEYLMRDVDAAGPVVRYLRSGPGRGPAVARNTGWRAATGEIIAFTDDDCVPSPEWLRRGLAAFDCGVAAVTGRVVVPLPKGPTDYERNAAWIERGAFVTANCFCRRNVLATVGGFDERFSVAWREDTDLYFSLMERGCGIVRAADALVVHPIRPAQWGVSVGQQRKSLFNALLYKKHPDLYRQRLDPPEGRYYGIVGSLLLALGSALARRRSLTAVSAGAWIILTGNFCMQRLRGASHTPRHVSEMIVTSILIPPLALFWRLRGALRFRVLFL